MTTPSRDVTRAPCGDRSMQVIARCCESIQQSQAELASLSERHARAFPEFNAGWMMHAVPFRQAVFGQTMRMYPILRSAAGLVLLIVCANVSNLLLARAASRKREIAVRMALGARRWPIIRQILSVRSCPKVFCSRRAEESLRSSPAVGLAT